MKRHFLLTIYVLLLIVLSEHITPRSASAQDKTIYGLAVLDLQANSISEREAIELSNILHSSISKLILNESDKLKKRYILLERSQMDKIFDQFEIRNVECTDLACAVEYGEMLYVDRVIFGSVSLVGSRYVVIASIADVEARKIVASVYQKQRGSIDNVTDLMPIVARELLAGDKLAATVPTIPEKTAPLSTVSPTIESKVMETQAQYLAVTGTPEGVSVFINGENIGETPIDNLKMNPGRYTVRLINDGFESYENELVLAPGENKKYVYKLTPLASLSVSGSPDGATMLIDKTVIGKTPLTNVDVVKGIHTLKVTHDGYKDFENQITLYAGQKVKYIYTLQVIKNLSIDGKPRGASVSIDGKYIGESPIDGYTIKDGSHSLLISLKGYQSCKKTITIDSEKSKEISYVLIPKTRNDVVVRSLFIPGAGQWYADRKGKGALILAMQLAAAGSVVSTSLSAHDAWENYNDAERNYKTARAGEDFNQLYDTLNNKYNLAKKTTNVQIIAISAAAAVYLYNVIDALRTEPKVEINPDSRSFRIGPVIGKDYTGISAGMRF